MEIEMPPRNVSSHTKYSKRVGGVQPKHRARGKRRGCRERSEVSPNVSLHFTNLPMDHNIPSDKTLWPFQSHLVIWRGCTIWDAFLSYCKVLIGFNDKKVTRANM